jgi:hypothetical protein
MQCLFCRDTEWGMVMHNDIHYTLSVNGRYIGRNFVPILCSIISEHGNSARGFESNGRALYTSTHRK